ncbi:hypothetical protein AYI69_g5618 [Smittium culicis]|uniref:Uncharacterized protein n=1 Tax=Smittium culicis TaxID=133412 RepID=A0A1R1Y4T6_9FUNG|nr:hypothetical protein AYI69_g5618 [Smittium culicis]
MADIAVHHKIFKALLSIEKYLYNSLMTEEERKIAIQSTPKTSSMNYNPPPLHDTATGAVKKTDSFFYGIHFTADLG